MNNEAQLTWKTSLLIAITVAMAGAVVYAPTLVNELTYDDFTVVGENPRLGALVHPGAYVSSDYFRLSREATYRPMVTASYALDYSIWGRRPVGYHLSNTLWHGAACAAFFAVCLSLGAPRGVCGLAALLYAFHPVHSEAACAVGFREDLLCALFYFAALALWPAGREPGANAPGANDWLRALGALLCFVAAGLSKEMALTFPALALAKELRFWRHGGSGAADGAFWAGRQRKAAIVQHSFAWALAIGLLVLSVTFTSSENSAANVAPPFFLRAPAFFLIAARYLRLLVVPWPLSVEYFIMMMGWLFWMEVAGAFCALATLGAAAWRWRRRFPAGFEAFVAFLLMLGPVSNVAPLFNPMAERYLTIPSAAFCWVVANALAALRPRRRWAAACVLMSLYAALTVARERQWRTAEQLWRDAIKTTPTSSRAWMNLGYALDCQGNQEEAAKDYRMALTLNPKDPKVCNNVALAMFRQGRLDEAIALFRRTLQMQPRYVRAMVNLALALAQKGDMAEAKRTCEAAMRLEPDDAEIRIRYGAMLEGEGRAGDAKAQYETALRLDPLNAKAHSSLSALLADEGRLDEAVIHARAAARLNPRDAAAQVNLGAVLAETGNLPEAQAHLERAVDLAPGAADARFNLAIVLEKQGKRAEAAAQYERALKDANAKGNKSLAASIEARWKALKIP